MIAHDTDEREPRQRLPVLFVGHGSPLNLILDNDFTSSLKRLGRQLPRPRAILVISAHWLTEGIWLSSGEWPEQICDFYGFPQELYRIRYRTRGAPDLARRMSAQVRGADIDLLAERGIDHAAWAVLFHMYPEADIPVLEMSLDTTRPDRFHFEFAREFAFLRDEGVLIIGSGNIVHNLGSMDPRIDAPPYEWAAAADERIHKTLLTGARQALIRFPESGEMGRLAVPSRDHYWPLLYTAGLREKGEKIRYFHEGIQYASVSMRSFSVG